jgi:hypothetical protein
VSNQTLYFLSGITIFIVGLCLTVVSILQGAISSDWNFILLGIFQGTITVVGSSYYLVNGMLIRDQYRRYD